MSRNQSGYIKFLVIFLILPLLALVFLKPPLTPNPKVDYGACSGSLAANKSFRFDFASNALRSPNNQNIEAPNSSSSAPYGLIQINNTLEGSKITNSTELNNLKCDGNNCRFINLDTDPNNANSPYKQINNQVFRLFKENNLVPKVEFPWHLGWVGQVALPDEPSKKRNVWIVLTDCHGNRRGNVTDDLCAIGTDIEGKTTPNNPNYDPNKAPSAAGWEDPSIAADATQPAFFLLYVQKDTPTIYADHFLNFDLYYKVGNDGELDLTRDLPKFILNFCKNSEPITPLSIVQTGPGSYNPPKILDLSDTSNGNRYTPYPPKTANPMECPGDAGTAYPSLNQKFRLMLYTKFGGITTTIQSVRNAANPQNAFCGLFTLGTSSPGSANDDSSYYVGIVSFAKFVTLTDTKLNYIYYYLPDNSSSTTPGAAASPQPNHNLQLTTFNLDQVLPWGWWIPECKPAIYLYPPTSQEINVKVTPKGYLTYTDPPYPLADGWNVTAHPDGQIISNTKTYPYLYYESKIQDEWIDKPLNGYVVSKQNLTSTLADLLPKLGLNPKESQDFIQYWTKSLTNAPYYYIGILSENAIDKIEPLQITPKPDTTIRVRLYFKALTEPIITQTPNLPIIPSRQGFTVVEWGGLVKNDPNHPFTCSQ